MSHAANQHERLSQARALLEWYALMGADEAVGDTGQSWADLTHLDARTFIAPPAGTPAPRPHTPSSQPPTTRPPQQAPSAQPVEVQHSLLDAPANDDILKAREDVKACTTLAELRTVLEAFEGCRLKATATNLCFYRGAERARIMIIGEAPGRDEDVAGEPFVGRAGKLLDKMLAAINLDPAELHITNTVYWRPPGNRPPTPEETQLCWPFLERQIALVEPDYLMLMGGAAAKTVLSSRQGIMKLRGKWHELSLAGRPLKIMPALHPAYLLRTPAAKRLAWRDLLTFEAALQAEAQSA